VPRNYAKAAGWYRKAADQGDANAQHGLGSMYFDGEGVPQNYAEAVRWYRNAAEQGEAFAQCDLGFMYYYGQGVLQDYVQARIWMSLAASRTGGDRDHDCVRGRNLVAKKMTAEQIAEAERLAREWKPREQPTAAGERDSQR
jgi:predicted Zn-dependent protease